jgi:ABC-type multidrug transport system fused ATPase/permease subunit
MRVFYRLLGAKATALLVATLPIGIALGMSEILTASVLFAVLVEFNLVPTTNTTFWNPLGAGPIITLLCLGAVTGALRYLMQFLPNITFHIYSHRLREALVRNVLSGITERSVMSVPEVSNMISNLIPKSGDLIQSLAASVLGLCLMFLTLSGMIYLSWQLTATIIVFAIILVTLLLVTRQIYGGVVEHMYDLYKQFSMNFLRDAGNVYLLRIFGTNESEADRLIDISKEYVSVTKRYYSLFTFANNVSGVASIFFVVGILWLNYRMSFVSVEKLVPIVYLLSRAAGGIGGIGASLGQVRLQRPYIVELIKYEAELFPNKIYEPVGTEAPAQLFPLDVKELVVGRETALVEPVSIGATAGDVVLISGSSGKGKTTLVMTLIGVLKPISGIIKWGGVPIEGLDPIRLRDRFGYAGPDPYLLDSDIRTNLLFGTQSAKISDADIERALHIACAEFVFDLKGGLAYRLREGGEGISAGQKQRIAIARCILRKPDVILMDEATANIDEVTERIIFERLQAAFPDILIIAVSHRTSLRRYATTFLEL